MNENLRWVVGGLVGIVGLILGALVSVQGAVDETQNLAIAETKLEFRRASERSADVLERITVQQTETATKLQEVARTLERIDEGGTRAFLRDGQ
tara:strand:+ start:676 stop:957 length:282 start_codon:yes stop_codon:yes gene_type:complete